ncbi:STAS domain-containing protein [Maridesulfovibrio salexigens]|uniref:Anti-sigma-factor antagonist n=1 Tax=Maridesulfovibrio salexigens (strain ATCC 14822 / DSM 2638 / NCIMB 8403 / VKM B-1763) TaxID=526222 RepID=C6C246_MARSD|nr:STAS domain-containing protein [Maridesulfovibrio salexigens]ACS81247.1 anti-sigma-factor antagonist [Maridesulfovibrio salexigens DSM 2638]
MEITVQRHGDTVVVGMSGRIDAFGAGELERTLKDILADEELACMAFDMTDVRYLSSAGIRSIVRTMKILHRRNGALAICALCSYCRNVLDTAGMISSLNIFATRSEAMTFLQSVQWERQALDNWESMETADSPIGKFRFVPGENSPSELKVIGSIADVFHSRVDETRIFSRGFSQTEYSIGVGGLGDVPDDYMKVLGSMITIGGTMAWLPTDGHDLADFLVPRNDTGSVMIRTPFNLTLSGGFNEYIMFESTEEGGTTLDRLYRGLFLLARRRRRDFKGVLGVASWMQVSELMAGTMMRSPVREFAPENKKAITDPVNSDEWFKRDVLPRHRNVSCLTCGVGIDLSCDLSVYDQSGLYNAFYIDPVTAGERGHILNNHAAVFEQMHMPEKMVCLDKVVRDVSAKAEFKDMRKLRDNSRVTRAFLGVSYIRKLVRDDVGWQGTAEIPISRSIAEKRYREEAEFPLVPQKREAELNKFQRFLETQQAKLGNKD